MDWLKGFFIPIIEVCFIGGILSYIGYYIGKAFWNAWSKSLKFTFKYKMPFLKKPYDEKKVKWILDCMDQGIGYYDAKKILMVKMHPTKEINEIMWLYDQLINQLNNEKGGVKHGRKSKRSDSETQSTTELPTV